MDRQRYFRKILVMQAFAESLSSLSECKRAQCGAIVFPSDCSAVLAIGYNGQPRGTPNDACVDVPGGCGCVHAEANAIAKLDARTVRRAIMYSTTMPCRNCAGLIVNCGAIVTVIYGKAYRDDLGRDILQRAGVAVISKDEVYAFVQERRSLS